MAKEREFVAEAEAVSGQAVDDYNAIGQCVAKLQSRTMAGVIAKLFAAASDLNEDDLKDDAHNAVIASAALDLLALNARGQEGRA